LEASGVIELLDAGDMFSEELPPLPGVSGSDSHQISEVKCIC